VIDLDKLDSMLDAALARETPESLSKWQDEQEKKDRAAGIVREEGRSFFDLFGETDIIALSECLPDNDREMRDDQPAKEPVWEALIKYRLTASPEKKTADLARLEKECHTKVDAYKYIDSLNKARTHQE